MDKYNTRHDKLAFVTEEPEINYLISEFNRSIFSGSNVARFNEADNIRFARWDSQSEDGKKHSENMRNGEQAFPFEGASDVRIRLIDQTINELVAIMMTSWQRSQLRISGVDSTDSEAAGAAHLLMRWIVENKIRGELEREIELWIQYTLDYGWSVMHVGWEQKLAKRKVSVSMEEVEKMASENPSLAMIVTSLKAGEVTDISLSLIQNTFGMTKKEAGKFLRDIGKEGVGTIFESYVAKNLPVVAALKPYDEVAVPPETLELQDARVVFRRTFMTEFELRATAQAEAWDEEFVEEACGTQGKTAFYALSNLVPVSESVAGTLNRMDNLIEVVYAYTKQITEDGTPCVHYTIFCPNVREDCYAKHEMLDYGHGEYPFVVFRRENVRRALCETRGIPEISYTDQEEIKAQHDSSRDRTAFETLPPMMVKKRGGTMNRIGPGVLLPVQTTDDYKFMPPPAGSPNLAFNLIQKVEEKNSAYYGLYNAAIPQIKTQVQQQYNVNKFLNACSDMYKQMFSLCLQYMSPDLIERITGTRLDVSPSDAHDQYDFAVKFDTRELDVDWNIEKLKAISSFVLPMDSVGSIDRSKLIQRIVESISPDAARDLLVSPQNASQKTYDDMQTNVAKMLMGIEPAYPENDPQAQQKMQAMQEIISKSQRAQQFLSSDQQVQAIFQNYQKSLQMSLMQQQNKVIGRTGVSPVSDKFMQEQQQAQQEQAPQQGMPPQQ